jgi:N-acetylmuramoyl-L-alanine amidase
MARVREVINQCNTGLVRGLSLQIIAEMNRLEPNVMVNFADLRVEATNIKAVNLFLQPAAKEALRDALADRPNHTLKINSAYRTIAQQFLLRAQFEKNLCNISAAARPGLSNHEDGLALDTSDFQAWRPALEANGWDWLGPGDPVHFDFRGGGVRSDISIICIRAFQSLWNRHNPDDRITTDGVYGPQTEARLREAPAEGFTLARTLKPTQPPMTGPDVRKVQEALTNAGFEVALNGVFDANTAAKVKSFQEARGLVVDGIVGTGTLRALGMQL